VALQRSGFFLAQAYVPEQTIVDGVVTIQVLIGRLGAIKLELEPGVKVSPKLMDDIVDKLRGHPIAERELIERALFTLGDLRGITISSSLTPGEKVGQADLTIKVSHKQNLAYGLEFDNGGSIFTGRYRINAGLDWFNLAGRGDVASLKAQVSTNGGTAFARASWLVPVNSLGTKLGVAASFLHYKLGSTFFEALDANGTASALSLQLLHPQIRSRNSNLFLQASADVRKFEDKVNTIGLVTKKGVTSYVTLGAVGDFRDTAWGGGISNYSANVVAGRLKIDSPDDFALDQSSNGYKAAGNYAKLLLQGSRLQTLPNKDSLYLSANAQFAGKDLDSSEKFSLGGPFGVRGYAPPESPSDSGLIVSWEYRKPFRVESAPGDFVFAVFGDYGIGQLHHSPLPVDTENIRRLVSHGVGVTYDNEKGLLIKAWLAARGGTKAQSDDSRARLYILLSQQY
jgi:hemolysin activation/secretion protein